MVRYEKVLNEETREDEPIVRTTDPKSEGVVKIIRGLLNTRAE